MSNTHPTLESVAANFVTRRMNRRALLTKVGVAGAAAVGAGLLGETTPQAKAALGLVFGPTGNRFRVTDVDILNFALNLEYLEAEFYQRAVNGVGLSAADTSPGSASNSTQGTVNGPTTPVPFASTFIKQYATEIAADELTHVRFLRTALGSAAVAEPSIDVSVANFTTVANTAGITGTFNPYANDTSFLLGGYIFEDVGVTAYHGGSPYIQNSGYLSAAAGILAVEAYHANTFRLKIFEAGAPYTTQANQIAALRNAASAAADNVSPTDQGVTNSDGTANLVPTDANSIAFARSFAAVLNIVYLNTTATPSKGGFFPNGLNGRITSLAAPAAAAKK